MPPVALCAQHCNMLVVVLHYLPVDDPKYPYVIELYREARRELAAALLARETCRLPQ